MNAAAGGNPAVSAAVATLGYFLDPSQIPQAAAPIRFGP